METHGVRYLGSKRLLVEHIANVIKEKAPSATSVIDVFTGTTRVAQFLRQLGYNGVSSDLSWASSTYAGAFLQNENNAHLQPYIDELNSLKGYEGWLTTNYCDAPAKNSDKVIRVWKPKNGMKADAIRDKIETYDLKDWEKKTLITSLIFALETVDNTIGLQQAYLKEWCSRTDNDLKLTLFPSIQGPKWQHLEGDALLVSYPKCDIAYLDPPYTGAVYSTYYHIWDSIARWDKPETCLKTNRRIDRSFKSDTADLSMKSPWNFKKTALEAFTNLVHRLPVEHLVISYSDESLVSREQMFKMLQPFKDVELKEMKYKRHLMAKIGAGANKDANMENVEYIFYARKST